MKYIWDFGDNSGVAESNPVTSHSYIETDTYNVTLSVIDSEGFWDTTTQNITIRPKSANTPTASFTYSPNEPLRGEAVTFDASSSTDPDGTIAKYRWNFGDNTTIVEETVPSTTHTYATASTYDVMLTVMDNNELSDSTSATIKILNPGAPKAAFTYEPKNPIVNQLVTFNASLSTPNGGAIVSYFWDFGDQTNGTDMIAAHNYTSFGYYRANLTVMDSEGYFDSVSAIIKVNIRDVSIIGVTPSANKVYSGQPVTITVIARNHGTTTENFNVTLYYQDSPIATQVVMDLVSGAQRTLTFNWNTKDVTSDFNYTIMAKANVLSWETYTTDNTYIDGTVRVLSSAASQPFSWSFLFPYIIPISLGLASFMICGIMWKKRKISLKVVGFEYFDDITHGGIPEASSVMITGEAGSGKSILCQELVHTNLAKGKACIYVTYDTFPEEVRKNMQSFHWDVSTNEKKEAFILIDSYSSIAGKKSQEKHMVEQPFVLSDLGIAISTAMKDVKEKSLRVFIDSATPLFMHIDATNVMKFLQDRTVKIKSANGVLLFTTSEGSVPPDLRDRLEEIVDCIIELKITREKEKILRKLRVKKMRGRESSQIWVPINIEPGEGITFFLPKGSSKNRKRELKQTR